LSAQAEALMFGVRKALRCSLTEICTLSTILVHCTQKECCANETRQAL